MLPNQSCPTLCSPMDYTVHGILQARILEWVAFPFPRGFSQPRDRTQVSHIVGEFLISWATMEAQEYWSGQPIPSLANLPDPGIQLGSPALQADSLPTELIREVLTNHFSKLRLASHLTVRAQHLQCSQEYRVFFKPPLIFIPSAILY